MEAEAAAPAPAAPSSDLLAIILGTVLSVEPVAVLTEGTGRGRPPADAYRVALTATNRLDLTPHRVSRLVRNMEEIYRGEGCRFCGGMMGFKHRQIDDEEEGEIHGCACSKPISHAMHLRADLCPACGEDPHASQLICAWCCAPFERDHGGLIGSSGYRPVCLGRHTALAPSCVLP